MIVARTRSHCSDVSGDGARTVQRSLGQVHVRHKFITKCVRDASNGISNSLEISCCGASIASNIIQPYSTTENVKQGMAMKGLKSC